MKKRTGEILELLDEKYGTEFICYLNYETPWQLLIATMLSAQCTDARVNIVTKDLFRKYPSVEAFADADLKELEQDIKPTGFYHNKAKNIIACMKDIRDKYNGEVPSELEDLLSLAGVGRKTANVIRGNIYHVPSVVVDTHVKRISNRLGLTNFRRITGFSGIFISLHSDVRSAVQGVQNVRIVSCKNIVKSIKCREIRYCLRKTDNR